MARTREAIYEEMITAPYKTIQKAWWSFSNLYGVTTLNGQEVSTEKGTEK